MLKLIFLTLLIVSCGKIPNKILVEHTVNLNFIIEFCENLYGDNVQVEQCKQEFAKLIMGLNK